MRKYLGFLLGLVGGVAAGALASPTPSAAETIRIAHSTWVGYGPLYVARDKGFFKNHGVDVELIVMEDPKTPSLLYAGTEFGVFASFDRGEHWTDLRLGLPHLPVVDMVVHPLRQRPDHCHALTRVLCPRRRGAASTTEQGSEP